MVAASEILLTSAGILLPSLGLSWLVRRWFGPLSWRVSLLLLGLVFAALHLGVFTSQMPVALDEVMRGYPYRGLVGEVTSQNPDTNDTVKQMLPWMQVAREELLAGRAPLWNRYSFSGYPLAGNAQSAPFSPFFLLTLFVTLPKQLVAMGGLKLFVSLLFGYLALRDEGLNDTISIFGSMVFAFSIFQNVYLYYPMSAVSCLLPAMVWAIGRSLRSGDRKDLLALALVTGAAFAGGHPETVFHLAIAAVIVMAINVMTGQPEARSRQRVGLTIAAALIGALLAAPSWFPVIEQIAESQRLDALGAGEFGSPTYPLNALWAMVNPDGFGNPARGNWNWIMHYIMVAPSYIGLIPLLLIPGALLAWNSDVRTRLFAASSLTLLLVALRWTLIGELFNLLPVASAAANDRIRFVMVMFAAIAASRRLEAITRYGPSRIDLLSGLTVTSLAIYLYRVLIGRTLVLLHVVPLLGLIVFIVLCAAAWLAKRHGAAPNSNRLAFAASVVLGLDLLIANLPFNALTPRAYFAPHLPIVDAIHQRAPQEPFRILGHDWVFLPNASAQYGLEDIRGSDPMAWGSYVRFFRLIQAEDQTLDVGRVKRIEHSAIDFLNVRFLMTAPGFDPGNGWTEVYSGPDGRLFENDERVDRFFSPLRLLPGDRSVELDQLDEIPDLTRDVMVEGVEATTDNHSAPGIWQKEMAPGAFRLTIDAPTRSFIASSQPATPGWRVEIDGETCEIQRVNGAFIGFWVPDGTSRVRVRYVPTGYRVGLGVGVLSLLGMVVYWRRSGARLPEGA